MFNQYPYLNLNDLNLDYILKAIREMKYEVTNFVSINAIKYANPIQWNITSQYEKNTIVIDPVTGTAYISVAPVPAGVALTRPEYWTVVFDLGSFVTRAAQNFTDRWESETTTTATFAINTGEWLVWGDVLYKAISNIIAGDTYVVGSNIEHFTIEDLYNQYLTTIANILALMGDLNDLSTINKTSLVDAINEVNERFTTPELFGAIGDGITDDTTAINNAVADALANNKILLLRNIYKIDGLVKITKGVNVMFAGGHFDVSAFDTATQTGGWVYFDNPSFPVTPEMFGAIGDGITDDTKAIQNAIDANLDPDVFPIGKTQAEVGEEHSFYNALTVELNNVYMISSTIAIRAEQHFNKLLVTSEHSSGELHGSSADPANFDYCAIEIEKPDNYPASDVDTQTHKTIEKIKFKQFQYGVRNMGTDLDCRIRNNDFQDISHAAIYLSSCTGTWVENNYCSWVYGYVVDLSFCNGCMIIDNYSGETSALGKKGIRIVNGSGGGNKVSGNIIPDFETNHSYDVVTGNTIDSVELKSGNFVILSDNYLNGVEFSGGNYTKIINNSIHSKSSGSGTGVLVADSCDSITISNNNIVAFDVAVSVYKDTLISDNVIKNNNTGIVTRDVGRNIAIDSNQLMTNTTAIRAGASNERPLITNNMFINDTTALGVSGLYIEHGFCNGNSFINCTTVNASTMTDPARACNFGINYSTQMGMVNGPTLE